MFAFRNTQYRCASEITLELISGKWKILILSYLAENTFRFSELQKLMPGTTQKMLTAQLRDLENDGLIIRKVYPVAPPKVEYYLTEFGSRLTPMLRMLCEYGEDYVKSFPSDAPRTEDQHA
ncbi:MULTISPECIES: winged helix-turn-helix transcriptional regulator [Paenibacillus]|uniref:winged helix-turn-helix transcriptional regulator n=1 Tax=Paenibacillus TaxID=44249 RepID=UPI0022B90FAD|nr:helix-turn-helix domain-containing protein [Paenibacillus caseinilyticus]MCZ8519440.1 helix-turn-helix domain-containing protein [Paenibacillus caseinilyticus]